MNKRKEKAIKLRKLGYSYGMIKERLQISRSTLSYWFKDMLFKPNKEVIERIRRGPFISGEISHNKRVKNIAKAKALARKELGKISRRDLWMLGIGLYIGEGSKAYETVQIINSNPEVIKLAIRWFKDICGLTSNNMTVTLHLYPDNNIKKCVQYWRKTTKIPAKQFRKEHIDLRTNKTINKNKVLPYGTARISIISNGNPDFGVNLHRKVMGWIESSLGQI